MGLLTHSIRPKGHQWPRFGGILVSLAIAPMSLLLASPANPEIAPSNVVEKQQTDLSRLKNRRLAEVDPANLKERWGSYRAISEIFDQLWLDPHSRTPLKHGEYTTFKAYPSLRLEDRDGDGKSEFFAYLPPDQSDRTQEFGAFFDLNGDGRTDWIVFYGGILITKKMKPLHWHHHSIDTNGDGLFDVRVYSAIDWDGDGFPDEKATAWVHDLDHDGLVDRADHIVKGRVTSIDDQDGFLALRYILNPELSQQPRIGGPMPTELFRIMAGDIDDLAER